MMRIGLFGYGKMGKMIDSVATERQHEIAARIDLGSDTPDFSKIDVAIDFSTPEAAPSNIISCLKNGVPVISGTTGWLDRYEEVTDVCLENDGAFLYASNFSLGVNLFFQLNKYLASLMNPFPEYGVNIEEQHHTQKLDAPSGTAISLAEGIIARSTYEQWSMGKEDNNVIPIHSIREDDLPGTHIVRYSSHIDDISIRHEAHNRKGFAFGAVLAAEWIRGKHGIFGMDDVLNLR